MAYPNYFKLNQNAKVIAIFAESTLAESTLAGTALEDLALVKKIVITDEESLQNWLSFVDGLASKYWHIGDSLRSKVTDEQEDFYNSLAGKEIITAEKAGDMFSSMFDMILNLK